MDMDAGYLHRYRAEARAARGGLALIGRAGGRFDVLVGRGHYPFLFHTGKRSGSHPSIETLLAKINSDMIPCQDSELRKKDRGA